MSSDILIWDEKVISGKSRFRFLGIFVASASLPAEYVIVVIVLDANPLQEHYDNFFEDVFVECEDKYGPVEEMNVCDNLGDHLVGNVYVKFKKEEDADKAVKDLNNRWFGGRPIYAELTPVTDFREACCRFEVINDPIFLRCWLIHFADNTRQESARGQAFVTSCI